MEAQTPGALLREAIAAEAVEMDDLRARVRLPRSPPSSLPLRGPWKYSVLMGQCYAAVIKNHRLKHIRECLHEKKSFGSTCLIWMTKMSDSCRCLPKPFGPSHSAIRCKPSSPWGAADCTA